jgi:hypothetical protein
LGGGGGPVSRGSGVVGGGADLAGHIAAVLRIATVEACMERSRRGGWMADGRAARSRRFCGGRADRAVAACTGGRIAAVAGLRVCRRMEAGAVYTWVLIVVEIRCCCVLISPLPLCQDSFNENMLKNDLSSHAFFLHGTP